MNQIDLPPAGVGDNPGAGWGGPPPLPPRRARRSRASVVVAALLGAAIVALAAIGIAHLFASSAPVLTMQPPAGSGVTVPAAQVGPSTGTSIASRVDPGLVDINVMFGNQGARGAATGMVLTPSGEVLTNNHVIQGATSINATDVGNGKTYPATVVGYDRSHDVAVLQLQGAGGLQTVPLGDSSTATVGARVTALGNAGGTGGTPHVAGGSIIALGQTITASDIGGGNAERLSGLIQTNAAIRPGDSGGPMVNGAGQVIGMDAAASAPTRFVVQQGTQGFAIPINDALSISKQIDAGVTSSTVHIGPTGFLGVEVIPTGQPGGFGSATGTQRSGAFIGGTLPGYPAAQAGLAKGDVITSVDGQTVTTATGLTGLLSAHHPGDTVQIQWVDPSGHAHSAAVKLASGPAA